MVSIYIDTQRNLWLQYAEKGKKPKLLALYMEAWQQFLFSTESSKDDPIEFLCTQERE